MADPLPREQLIANAKAGDQLALERLLVMYGAATRQFIAGRLSTAHQSYLDPEDILQQTFIHAFRDIRQLQGETQPEFEAWLKAIAENRWRDAARALNRAKRGGQYRRALPAQSSTNSIVDLVELLSAGGRSPSSYLVRDEVVMAVQDAIRRLPANYRQAIELRFLEGKSLDEAAVIMNCSSRAVQGLVDRAKKKMRQSLERLSI
jgi:RNA polymerase sigma-70 factor (ECF subfamily)